MNKYKILFEDGSDIFILADNYRIGCEWGYSLLEFYNTIGDVETMSAANITVAIFKMNLVKGIIEVSPAEPSVVMVPCE